MRRTEAIELFRKERAEEIQKKISNTDLELVSVDRKPKKTMAPGLMI